MAAKREEHSSRVEEPRSGASGADRREGLFSRLFSRMGKGDANRPAPDKKKRLEAELDKLEARRTRRGIWNRLCLFLGLIFLASAPFLYGKGEPNSWIDIVASAVYGIAFLSVPILWPLGPLDSSIRALESEIDLLEDAGASAERRAEKLFRLHQLELKRYYDQTLSHSAWIFWVGILCIGFGFVIILASLLIVALNTRLQLDFDEKRLVAILGAVSGILVNFIAVIYLKMHGEIVKSLTEFHNRLVATHHLHFGNFLAAKLKNPDVYEETLSQMALKLADQSDHKPE